MKKSVLFLLMLFFMTLQAFSQMDTIYFDDFSDNRHYWNENSSEYNSSKIESGNYVWQRKQSGLWTIWETLPGINDEEFFVEVSFKIEGNGFFGLLWGAKDANNAYYFLIHNSGVTRSFLYSRETYVPVNEDIFADNMVVGFNTFSIYKKANKVHYQLNGKTFYEEYFSGFFGNSVGFVFKDISVFYIDKILVKHNINLVPGIKYTEKPVNLSASVNTSSSEISPIVTPDGKGIFFVRVEDAGNKGGTDDYSDIYFSKNESGNQWQPSINLGEPLNNRTTNAVNSVTPDGNTLFLLHTYYPSGDFKASGLSISNRKGNSWEVPTDIDVIDHYNLNDYNEFCMSNDKQIIIMAVERNETFGVKDLYVSFLIGGQLWSLPLNLGPVVNTVEGEISPFLAADNTTLYFSSNGHPGYGSNDVFLTRRLDDTWTNWSKPENLGKPINTDSWDAYYSVPASGEYAYFVSSKSGFGNSDIFRVKLPETARPNPVVLVKGKVLNQKTKEPLQAIINYFDLQNSEISGTAMSNPETGVYQITLPAGRLYGFLASSNKFLSVSENIDLKELGEYKELERDLYLVPIEIGEKVRLNNIFFETGKWELLPESYNELDELVKILTDNPAMVIKITGHTDNVGNDDSNMTLSQKRAAAVVNYLLNNGISNSRLDSAGFGETQPVASNDTDEGRALNRRVEFVIIRT
jgi:outer membrane protein OmpA-like peptidoglycan-associated protein